nr:TonB-dependent receptor [uncultured Sphaerochaeta sp.]
MKKRGIFSLVLLLALSPLFAAQDITDLGTAFELVVAESSLAEAQTNTASSVSVLGKEEIASYNAQTTAELVGKAIGTSFNSYGSLGALQTVVIRGATSSKNLIYLDGVLLSSAHNGSVDLSIIPIDIIESIEIIKSGPGNLGRTNAIGGMVNIITKKGQKSDTPFSLTVENGSFLPVAYGTNDDRNWASLADSQKLDLSYTNENLVASVGGLTAQNAYTYDNAGTKLRDNAQVYEVHGSANYKQELSDLASLSTQNLVSYKNLGLPGGYIVDSWGYGGLTPNDYEQDLLVSSQNMFELDELTPNLEKLTTHVNYSFARTFYHDDDYQDSTHNKHKAAAQAEATWNLGENYALTTDVLYSLDYVDSTDVGKNARNTISSAANASLYFQEGKLSLHPSVNVAFISDLKALSPNASLGFIYLIHPSVDLSATLSYAENVPTFSDLYWPSSGNPNLKTEKGLNADLGLATTVGNLTYEGTLFGRNIYNAIAYSSTTYLPDNIAHSVYLGTEQSVEISLNNNISLQASYQYNKSYDLSNGKTFADNVEVSSVRKHTAKGSLFLAFGKVDGVLSAEYLGKTSTLENVFLVNLSTSMQVTEALNAYVAIDNLLNTSYELTSGGYPMPGTKIRLGGKLRF